MAGQVERPINPWFALPREETHLITACISCDTMIFVTRLVEGQDSHLSVGTQRYVGLMENTADPVWASRVSLAGYSTQDCPRPHRRLRLFFNVPFRAARLSFLGQHLFQPLKMYNFDAPSLRWTHLPSVITPPVLVHEPRAQAHQGSPYTHKAAEETYSSCTE